MLIKTKNKKRIHIYPEFSKSIVTPKQASKVSNKLNTKSAGNNSIDHNDSCDTCIYVSSEDQLKSVIDISFPNSQLIIDGYSQPFIYDRNRFGEGALIYILDDIPCQELSEHKFPIDIEGIFIEINLRKTKWLILGTYRPPNQSIDYFLENVGTLREEKSARIKKCGIN